ncbi:adenosine deaminase family protein [Coraliomargarita parva]|uniref:adenosine deaminase family protein n=1 Tax=Coraliomargarita parva TaxID=3014050 RepID=UPI0022B54A47|nr:adenosine deaminase [Coraliomargarita parva]
MQANEEIIHFINRLPKGEHHLHIDGSPPWHRMQASDPERYQTEPPSWADHFRFPSFDDFEAAIVEYVVPWLNSPERYALAAADLLETRKSENVKYVEFSFAALAVERSGVDLNEVAEAIYQSIPDDLEVRLFAGLHHKGFSENQDKHLADILSSPYIHGIDLHGHELFPLRPWIIDFWKDAEAAGKLRKAHASELTGPLGVREVIEKLGVRKIQHGVQAMHDPEVVQLAASVGASFDVCPISNVKLLAVESAESHPILELEEAGIRCTINTDDPFIFGNAHLKDDYLMLHQVLGATPAQLAGFAKNSFTTADLSDSQKQDFCAEIDSVLEDFMACGSA